MRSSFHSEPSSPHGEFSTRLLSAPTAGLTEREQRVFAQAAQGLSSAEIAARLAIRPRTVEAHRANLMRKLRVKTQTDLVLYAIRLGIISP